MVRAGAVGDVLLLRPAVHSLRRAGYEPVLMAPAAPASVLVGSGGSEVAALIDWERADVAALLDPGAALPRSLEGHLAGVEAALVCSRNAALAGRLRALAARVDTVDPIPPAGVHAGAWYASALGVPPPADPPPALVFSATEEAAAGPVLSRLPPRFLAVHPGSGSAAKNWPAERYAALVRALARGKPWLQIEGPADAAAAAALAAGPEAVRARALPLRVLGAVLARAGLVVGNDSGVTHLAAAAGAPTLALFGPTDPAQWAPIGTRVAVRRAADGTMAGLPLDEVLAAARALT